MAFRKRMHLGWVIVTLAAAAAQAAGQAAGNVPGNLAQDLRAYVTTPALSGYESALADHIAGELRAFSPQRDNFGDVIVHLGPAAAAAPDASLRLLVTPLDEPGYFVSGITPDGYLRLQRLPTRGRLPLFNTLASAQPVRVGVRSAGSLHWLNGVVTGLSVHLQSGRIGLPDPENLDNLYVDIGAASAAEVRSAGVDVLSPVVLDRTLYSLAGGAWMGASIGDKYGAAVVVDALRHLDPGQVKTPVVVAFVNQSWDRDRGLARVEQLVGKAEVTRVGRGAPSNWAIPVKRENMPAATIAAGDLQNLLGRVEQYLGAEAVAAAMPAPGLLAPPAISARPAAAPAPEAVLADLVAQYGVDPHEQPVGETIKALLPPWAHPTTDAAGNISLHWGDGGPHAPKLLFVAHQDEIGFEVQSIASDGHLLLRTRGGGDLDYYVGHPVLVHTAAGARPGALELDRSMPLHCDVGAHSAAEVAQLGIAVGDSVTVPKRYRKLLGHRATARSFDDRVGSAALILAAWALGPSLPGRDVTLAWSTGEEIGLVGAKAMAERLAAAGRSPDYVFAVDTFVSADTPLESHRFADTPIGEGFVIRAIDDSSITPWPLARRLRAMAEAAKIPVQWGTTGGGNDGSAFLPFGSVDLPMGWPLRTSHSPGEVIDTRDLDSLSRAVTVLARKW